MLFRILLLIIFPLQPVFAENMFEITIPKQNLPSVTKLGNATHTVHIGNRNGDRIASFKCTKKSWLSGQWTLSFIINGAFSSWTPANQFGNEKDCQSVTDSIARDYGSGDKIVKIAKGPSGLSLQLVEKDSCKSTNPVDDQAVTTSDQ